MATNYIKVSPYVAEKMGVAEQRCTYPDGNYQLWEMDLSKVDAGWVFRPDETVARIGGVMMDPYRNREEHDRKPEECVPLPMPSDPEWVSPEEIAEEIAGELIEEIEESIEEDGDEEGGVL